MSRPWSVPAIFSAARDGDVGTVIRLARKATGLTQAELGAACGYSQPVVSRIERGRRHAYDIRVRHQMAQALDLPPHLLGLAAADTTELEVNRRDFLATAGVLAATAFLPVGSPSAESPAAALRAITTAQRRLDGTIPSTELAPSVLAHLRLTQRAAGEAARTGRDGGDLAEAASEVAGYAGWLHWDMHDLGSAHRYYDQAIRASVASGNRVLTAYMVGSQASFAAEHGETIGSLTMVAKAHAALGPEPPAVAEAWLCAVSAVARASANDERASLTLLDRAEAAAARIPAEDPPPWPWVFAFTPEKVAAHRLACTIRLGRTDDALQAARDTGNVLDSPTRQALVWRLDHAHAYLQAGHVDRAFETAAAVIEADAGSQSARILDKARTLRRQYNGLRPPGQVREFDERLRAVRG
ncbi:MAG: helix-turn-helix domain-containing protein [Candidatus Limnocylindria bacterium]